MTTFKINDTEFKLISEFIESLSGVTISESQKYLLENRLFSLLVEERCFSYTELYNKCTGNSESARQLRKRLVSSITIHETLWFRDNKPFEFLKKIYLPGMLHKMARHEIHSLKILSASCSTGQEPYSIAMCVLDTINRLNLPESMANNIQIEAFDISETVLDLARKGRYSDLEISRGINDFCKHRYFEQTENGWLINEKVKRMVHFFQFNLLDLPHLGKSYDLIFVRNVLIYFSPENKQATLNNIASLLRPDGALILGSSESMIGLNTNLQKQTENEFIFYKNMIEDTCYA